MIIQSMYFLELVVFSTTFDNDANIFDLCTYVFEVEIQMEYNNSQEMEKEVYASQKDIRIEIKLMRNIFMLVNKLIIIFSN